MRLLQILRIVYFLAAILLPGCSSASQAIPDAVVSRGNVTATTAVETPSTGSESFKTYHNPQAGYSAEYPADWTVSEQVGADGSTVTTFSPADGSSGIIVMVQSGEFGGAGSSDIPNTRCGEVQVGERTGMRCFDTINLVASTTVVAKGKTFTITTLGKRLDERIYDRFVSSFRIVK
jgi:hypothetical protein